MHYLYIFSMFIALCSPTVRIMAGAPVTREISIREVIGKADVIAKVRSLGKKSNACGDSVDAFMVEDSLRGYKKGELIMVGSHNLSKRKFNKNKSKTKRTIRYPHLVLNPKHKPPTIGERLLLFANYMESGCHEYTAQGSLTDRSIINNYNLSKNEVLNFSRVFRRRTCAPHGGEAMQYHIRGIHYFPYLEITW
ncbi:MAG: hypothetical protein HRU19_22130 [Pseudobacteriovorax sp.]|nr:hypothetical protein [Pseudobacteriovorax sp.]